MAAEQRQSVSEEAMSSSSGASEAASSRSARASYQSPVLDEHTIALAAGLAEILRADGPWTRAVDAHHAAAHAAERLGRQEAHTAQVGQGVVGRRG